jgi:hypothetical protein
VRRQKQYVAGGRVEGGAVAVSHRRTRGPVAACDAVDDFPRVPVSVTLPDAESSREGHGGTSGWFCGGVIGRAIVSRRGRSGVNRSRGRGGGNRRDTRQQG